MKIIKIFFSTYLVFWLNQSQKREKKKENLLQIKCLCFSKTRIETLKKIKSFPNQQINMVNSGRNLSEPSNSVAGSRREPCFFLPLSF